MGEEEEERVTQGRLEREKLGRKRDVQDPGEREGMKE